MAPIGKTQKRLFKAERDYARAYESTKASKRLRTIMGNAPVQLKYLIERKAGQKRDKYVAKDYEEEFQSFASGYGTPDYGQLGWAERKHAVAERIRKDQRRANKIVAKKESWLKGDVRSKTLDNILMRQATTNFAKHNISGSSGGGAVVSAEEYETIKAKHN